jgi:glutaredoxin
MRKELQQLQEQLLNELAEKLDGKNYKAFVFTTTGCPYCDSAIDLLGEHKYKIPFTSIDVMNPESNYDIFEKYFPHGATKPQIWIAHEANIEKMPPVQNRGSEWRYIDGPPIYGQWKYIGGCDNLTAYLPKYFILPTQ